MISPYVRRLRLAQELHRLRNARKMSAEHLAHAVGMPRQRISGIENCRVRPDEAEVDRILNALDADSHQRAVITTVASDARCQGWWEANPQAIGPRQALYADLEAGAQLICEYQLTLVPGLLQVPNFTAARARADRRIYPDGFDPEQAVEARRKRQDVLYREIGPPRYEVVIDELAIRRYAAQAEVVGQQLDHLVVLGHECTNIMIRVLPLIARIDAQMVPRSAFSIYSYPDPDDPVLVAVDTITSDLVITQPDQVEHYRQLHRDLADAALTTADSLDFLATVAENLNKTG